MLQRIGWRGKPRTLRELAEQYRLTPEGNSTDRKRSVPQAVPPGRHGQSRRCTPCLAQMLQGESSPLLTVEAVCRQMRRAIRLEYGPVPRTQSSSCSPRSRT